MFVQERHRLILDILSNQGRVNVVELAEQLGISDDTVRRDLQSLSEQGFLQKVHGGAVALAITQMTRAARVHVLPKERSRIGAAVAARMEAGMTVFLDAGITVLEVARSLPSIPLTVITNSLDIANCLTERTGIQLMLTGGNFEPSERLLSGSLTVQSIASYRADLGIIGACAIHPKLGVTATGEHYAAIKRALIASSRRKFLLADHSKFDIHEPYFVAELNEFDELFTDRPVKLQGPSPVVNVIDSDEISRAQK